MAEVIDIAQEIDRHRQRLVPHITPLSLPETETAFVRTCSASEDGSCIEFGLQTGI